MIRERRYYKSFTCQVMIWEAARELQEKEVKKIQMNQPASLRLSRIDFKVLSPVPSEMAWEMGFPSLPSKYIAAQWIQCLYFSLLEFP